MYLPKRRRIHLYNDAFGRLLFFGLWWRSRRTASPTDTDRYVVVLRDAAVYLLELEELLKSRRAAALSRSSSTSAWRRGPKNMWPFFLYTGIVLQGFTNRELFPAGFSL